MAWFNKYYRCPCGTEWQDEWDCLCNDRCPTCDTECEPYDHAEIDEDPAEAIGFIIIIPKGDYHEETSLDLGSGCVDLRDLHTDSSSSDSET